MTDCQKETGSSASSAGTRVEARVTTIVHGKETLFLRLAVGKATAADGSEFELSTNAGTVDDGTFSLTRGAPIVRLPDGRWVVFPWSELVATAERAGAVRDRVRRTCPGSGARSTRWPGDDDRCEVCGRFCTVRRDGTLRAHSRPRAGSAREVTP